MQNVIEREITIKAPKEKIYDAIANPELVVKWFPDAIEGTYAVGEQLVFEFEGHGKTTVLVVDAKPYEYFSYRWVPGASHFIGDLSSVATTLVEFKITEEQDGVCKVTMTETGFADLPAEVAEEAFKQNSGGWDFMLGRLGKYFSAE